VMQQRGFQLINPTEKWFPGLNELRENFSSWDWRIGKTPKFNVQKNIELKSGDETLSVKLNVEVEKVKEMKYTKTKKAQKNVNICF
jgi:lipoyltransferase 1